MSPSRYQLRGKATAATYAQNQGEVHPRHHDRHRQHLNLDQTDQNKKKSSLSVCGPVRLFALAAVVFVLAIQSSLLKWVTTSGLITGQTQNSDLTTETAVSAAVTTAETLKTTEKTMELLNIVEGEHTTDGGWKRVQVKPRRARTSAIDVGMGEGNLERSSERSTRINRPDGSTTADPNAAKVKDCMCDSTWERCRMCDRGKMEKQRSNWDIEYID
jgi:hypothetical protein